MSERATNEQVLLEISDLKQQVQEAGRKRSNVMVFIDNTNLTITAKKLTDETGHYRIDYKKLVDFLVGGRTLKQCRIYYSDYGPQAILNDEEATSRNDREGFYNWLRFQGFWLKSLPLVEWNGQKREKGLDAAIIKDMERLARHNASDVMILVAGDADYKETIQDCQALYGIRTEVAFFVQYTAKILQYSATQFIDLSKLKTELRRNG